VCGPAHTGGTAGAATPRPGRPVTARQELPLLEIARLQDPVGVITVYVDAAPDRMTGSRPPFAIAIRNRLRALREEVKAGQPHGRWTAVHARLDALEPELARLLAPRADGRGRGIVAAVAGGQVLHVAIQQPLPDHVAFNDTPHLLPLLAAVEAGRPAGVVTVAREGVRAVEWRLGTSRTLAHERLFEPTGDWRPLSGPAGRSTPQSSAPQRDLFDRRLEEHQARMVAGTVEWLAPLDATHGWDVLVVSGDPRMTGPLTAALPDRPGRETIVTGDVIEWRSDAEVARMVEPLLARARERRQVALVRQAGDAARSGGAAVVGLSETLASLAEGRVERVLIDPRRAFPGVRAPGGRMAAGDEVPPGVDPAELRHVDDLAEAVAGAVIGTSGHVTVVTGAAADALAPDGGIAAFLRW
ncbi:MAG: VLRF1 family aeRF1-type release factor, partial [Actinomycetota bacterium]